MLNFCKGDCVMPFSRSNVRIFSGNMLKFIAAAAMICDHVGVILFPHIEILRIIGRLSFPIFAFMISEGAKYTKNRLRYLATMAGFAAVIQAVYLVYSKSLEMSVMVTFTLSICAIYSLDLLKTSLFRDVLHSKIFSALLFLAVIAAIAVIDKTVDLDYGFEGCMLPVFASLFVKPRSVPSSYFDKLDCIPVRIFATAIGMLLLAVGSHPIQYWSFFSLPLLLLYSEKRGTLKTKYFFYIFYPVHLVLIELISILID